MFALILNQELGLPLSYIAPSCFVLYFAVGFWCLNFSCPRCGKPFNSGYWHNLRFHSFFATKCVNCGLPKWADPQAENYEETKGDGR
jgi:endogenous inhibitor of DNA gyrase (YacG/DUF329 family)